MRRPKIGDQVIVDLPSEGGGLAGTVVEGPWISTGEAQGQPIWKVDHGDGFSNWYLEDRISPDPAGSASHSAD